MPSSFCTFVFLLIGAAAVSPAISQSSDPTEPMCYDWGVSREAVSVVEGQPGWLSCPLFSHPSVYNYTSSQNTGHNLFWYRVPEGHDLEQPISLSSRISKDRERLWLQPASAADAGQYICMLRNKSSCSKITMHLEVLPGGAALGDRCPPQGAVEPAQVVIPMQEDKRLHCPHLQDAAKMADGEPSVAWYHVRDGPRCDPYPFWNSDRQQVGSSLQVYVMLIQYQGIYLCTVSYLRKGRSLSFTRSINVTAVYPSILPKEPSILQPNSNQVFTVKLDTEVRLKCTGLFPYLESGTWDIWWTVDGKTVDQLADHRFSKDNRQVKYDFGDRTEESLLIIQRFQVEDLRKEYNCSVRNARGFDTRRAQLQEEASLPSVELGWGLGVTLVLMLLLFVVYHVFWLELLLLYRSWFGSDERHTDDKEYDVYISYARNSEDEHFVLSTLRSVLENQLGYSVCIFDRDSLPGGNLSESVLQSMQRSRRLLFVLSPDFLADKSFSLLECRLGLYLQHGHRASIVALVLRSVSKLPCVEAAQVRQAAVSTVSWRGARSEPLQSRFWLRLRLTLPVRPLALGRRLIDSTSSHSDLAALALQRAQQIHIQRDKANQNRKSKRASGKLKCQDQQVLLRDRDRLKRGATGRREGPQHIRSCPGCTGFVGQVEPSGAELTVETELQQAMDRTRIRPKVVPNTEPPPETGTHSDPDILHPNPDPNNPGEQNQQQQMTGSRTEYNGRQQEEEELGDA